MSLISKVAERIPKVVEETASKTGELIIAPAPFITPNNTTAVASLSIPALVLFTVVAILAAVTVWQTIKIFNPTLKLRF